MGNGRRSSIINYISMPHLTVSIASRVLLLIRRAKLKPNPDLIPSALRVSNPPLSSQVTLRLRILFKTTKITISKLVKIPKKLETRLQNDSSVRRPPASSPSLLRSISVNRSSKLTFIRIRIAKIAGNTVI
jgi:hypothetical protein